MGWTDELRARLVEALIDQVRRLLLPWYALPERLLAKLRHPELSAQIVPLLSDLEESAEVHALALRLVDATKINDVSAACVAMARNANVVYGNRVSAARIVAMEGADETKAQLKPLAFKQPDTDEDDELRGYALQATWPQHLSVDELLQALTPPSNESYLGSFWGFVSWLDPAAFAPARLVEALRVVRAQVMPPAHGHTFQKLEQRLLSLVPSHLDREDVREFVFEMIGDELRTWGYLRSLDSETGELHAILETLGGDETLRRDLFTRIVTGVGGLSDTEIRRVWVLDGLVHSEDVEWLRGQAQQAPDDAERLRWETLVPRTPLPQVQPPMMPGFGPKLSPPAAKRQPPLPERIQQLLELGLDGRPDVFWDLDRHLMFDGDGHKHFLDLGDDLKRFPGWKGADPETRGRIIHLAERAVSAVAPVPVEDKPLNRYDLTNTSTVRALQLLLDERPTALATLPQPTWVAWAPAILRYGSATLIDLAYRHADEACVDAAMALFDAYAAQDDEPGLPHLGPVRTHSGLRARLLERLLNRDLPDKTWANLLAMLLPVEPDAVGYAESHLPTPVDQQRVDGRRPHLAAIALRRYDQARFWPRIWAWVEAYPVWGRGFLRAVAPFDGHEQETDGITAQLSDDDVGRVMLWLHTHITPETDPDEMYGLITEDKRVRHWRDALVNLATERGVVQALEELQRVRPQLHLGSAIASARQNHLMRAWEATSPEQLLALALDPAKRIVRTPDDLLEVVIDALDRLQEELDGRPGVPPSWPYLWDGVDGPDPQLKKENRISDFIVLALQRMLGSRRVVVNREVQVRPGKKANRPEQIDIDVLASSSGGDTVRLFIEVKRSDHKQVKTALESQLCAYLGSEVHAGLYLVAWADKHETPAVDGVESLRELLGVQAKKVESEHPMRRVRVFVLNCSHGDQSPVSQRNT